MIRREPFFIGWRDAPAPGRRRALLRAGVALAAGGAAGFGVVLARGRADTGPGVWDQGELRRLQGVVMALPYPMLRTLDLDGTPRTVFLATDGKAAFTPPAAVRDGWAVASGTLITRGPHAMLATEALAAAPGAEPAGLRALPAVEQGEVLLTGEILDAKCWFGAMRPGWGKVHKACASLCARGGLPLAFCPAASCGAGLEAPLLLDAEGRPHGTAILPWLADPLFVRGRLLRIGGTLQLRAGLDAMRRL